MIEWWMVLTAFGSSIFLSLSAAFKMSFDAIIPMMLGGCCFFVGAVLLVINLLS